MKILTPLGPGRIWKTPEGKVMFQPVAYEIAPPVYDADDDNDGVQIPEDGTPIGGGSFYTEREEVDLVVDTMIGNVQAIWESNEVAAIFDRLLLLQKAVSQKELPLVSIGNTGYTTDIYGKAV